MISAASLCGWHFSKLDVKAALFQTASAYSNIYVIPQKDSANRRKRLWILLAAEYGIINANERW